MKENKMNIIEIQNDFLKNGQTESGENKIFDHLGNHTSEYVECLLIKKNNWELDMQPYSTATKDSANNCN